MFLSERKHFSVSLISKFIEWHLKDKDIDLEAVKHILERPDKFDIEIFFITNK